MRSDADAMVAAGNVTDVTKDLDPSVWKIVAVTVIGSFLSQLNATIVTVSLASLARELHSSLSTIQWVTSGYLLALTLALPLNGWLVDRMASTSLNIVQRLGGPTLTTLCATFLGWMLESQPLHQPSLNPYASAFLLLAALHSLVFVAALKLPAR